MAVITTGAHPKALWPGVQEFFGREYKKHPEVWKQVFDITNSTKAYEEDVELTGFDMLVVKPEGDAIKYDTEQQGYVTRYTHVVYGKGYIVTQEAIEDDQYTQVSKRRSSALAFSAQTTKEVVHANVLNRAFAAGFNGGDGVTLVNASHPTLNGTQSNLLGTPSDLSEAALEDLCIQIMNARNSRGLPIALEPQKLIVSANDYFNGRRILETELTIGSGNNDKNIVGTMFRGGLVCWKFLTDPDAWFVKTDVPAGLKHIRRKAGKFETDNEFDTANAKAKFTERYSCGWTDWRCIYGSAGT